VHEKSRGGLRRVNAGIGLVEVRTPGGGGKHNHAQQNNPDQPYNMARRGCEHSGGDGPVDCDDEPQNEIS
jgi:hypothetical protein